MGPTIALRGQFETPAQENQQLFRGAESQLPSGVDLFYPTAELTLPRFRLGPQLKHECVSHHL
jgi:hypothetical protein